MSDVEQDHYWVVARDKAGLLVAVMRQLAGNSHISFEGKLSNCKFPPELSPSSEETAVLRRNTISPVQDFVVLPLTQDTVRPILDIILPSNQFMRDIIHIQIEEAGKLQFGSYDNFHPECIVCYRGVAVELLETLKENGVIRSWTISKQGAQR